MLKVNTGLLELVLRVNNIDDDGASSLAASLIDNATLQILDLDGNALGLEFTAKITKVFTVCTLDLCKTPRHTTFLTCYPVWCMLLPE